MTKKRLSPSTYMVLGALGLALFILTIFTSIAAYKWYNLPQCHTLPDWALRVSCR